jgi:ABC-type molybdate transport system substrate-binding protein
MSRRHLARVGARLAALAALPLFGVCGPTGDTLEVFAAASLREVCGDLTPLFRARNPGVELRFDLAGSNLLAEQILASTRGGVFLSADDLQMDRIELTGRIVELSMPAVGPHTSVRSRTPRRMSSRTIAIGGF